MSPMAVKLFVSASRVVHVEDCIRIKNRSHPSKLQRWDGTGTVYPCRTCLFGHQVNRRRPLPCPRCGHKIARPCPHNGMMRAVERGGDKRRRHIYRAHSFPDLAMERDWLLSLLDS